MFTKRGAGIALLLLFTGTITLSVGLNLFLTITRVTSMSASAGAGTQSQTVLMGMGLAAAVALYGIVTPLVEEFVFRGMFYSALYTYAIQGMRRERRVRDNGIDVDPTIAVISREPPLRPFLIAAGISSVLFGVYHMNLAQGIYATLMGFSFCLAYELTGQFLSAWILHAACNIIALILTIQVNGTNAFTQLCTLPWTAAFLGIAIISYICLYHCMHGKN